MNWSLAAQLRLGFAVALLLALGVAATAWRVILDFQRNITRAYETQLLTTMQLAEAQTAFWQLRFGVRQFMIEGPEGQQRTLEQQDKWYAIIEERLAAYDKAASSADERRMLTGLRSAYQRYKQARPKFFELWQAGEKDDATAWLTLTLVPFGAQAAQAFDTQIALQRSFVEQDRERSERDARLGLALGTAITIVLLGMLVIGYVAAMRMLRPIRALRTQADTMVREHRGEAVKGSTRRNEVAALVESFELMAERLAAHTESLRQSRNRLEFVLGATPAVIWTSRIGGLFERTFISANVRAALGHEPEDFLRDPGFWSRNIHPEDRERILAGLADIEHETSRAHEYRLRHKDGSWRWIYAEASVVRDASGAAQELAGYWIDVTARVVAERERERAQQRLQLALEGGRLAVWDTDASSGKVWLSKEWSELLGEAPRETWTTVENLVALAHPEDRQRLLDAAVAVMKGERPAYSEEHRIRTATGEWRWILSRGRLTESAPDGRAARMSGTNLDITLRKETELELERTQAMLREALHAKSEFMNNVTHELRTPLNSVIGFAELLKDEVAGPLNAKQAGFADDILAGGRQLLRLVEGILEMSRLDTVAAVLEREPVEIVAALEGRIAAQRHSAEARGLTLRLDAAADLGHADADPEALRRMLEVLIGNAVKFSRDAGEVTLRARRAGGWLEIAVQDRGIGIAPEDLAKLFKPLVQLDARLGRKHGGVGLGLALARGLAELHGGTIEVESEPGKGSTFTLRLPLREKP